MVNVFQNHNQKRDDIHWKVRFFVELLLHKREVDESNKRHKEVSKKHDGALH